MRTAIPAVIGLAAATLLAAAPAAAQVGQPRPAGLTLEALEARALAAHPAIREAAARVAEARALAAQAGVGPNPTVGLALGEWRPREARSGYVGGFYEQPLTLGGKLAASRAGIEAEAARREAEADAVRLRLVAAVRARYYEAVAAEERVRVAEQVAAWAAEAVTVARQLANVGMADRPDVLAAEAEEARARTAVAAARAARQGAWRRLGAAVADPALAPQALAASVATPVPVLDRAQAMDRIHRESPELRAAAADAARARAGVNLARRAARPDLFLRGELGWNREPGDRPIRAIGWELGGEAGLSLPLVNRNRGGLAAALAAVTAAEAGTEVRRLDVEARFASAWAEYEAARAAADAYRTDVLPRAREAYDLYLARYREMAAGYPQVLVAQRTLFEMSEAYVDVLERAWRAAAAIEALVVVVDVG